MNLKSFGCSLMFGTDLSDNTNGTACRIAGSQLSWAALLAQHLNCSYSCYARPGAGNLQIAEQVLNQIGVAQSSDLFVVSWTWMDRFDYYSVAPVELTRGSGPWRTLLPVDTTAVARTYYKELHSEYRDKLTTLMNIKLIIDSLRQKQIPFLMTYMDRLMFDRRWNTSAAVANLQDFIEPFMTQFEGMSFLEWSQKNKYPISEAMHPLEEAHQTAADYMITVFDKQKTSDPIRLVRV
jgi:hypothetical protein